MNKHSAAACRALKIDKFLRTGNLLVFAGKIVITGWSRVNWYWTDWTQPQQHVLLLHNQNDRVYVLYTDKASCVTTTPHLHYYKDCVVLTLDVTTTTTPAANSNL